MSLDLSKLQAVADKLKTHASATPAPSTDSSDQAAVDALVTELEQVCSKLDPTPPSTTTATDSGSSSTSTPSASASAASGVEGTGWTPAPAPPAVG